MKTNMKKIRITSIMAIGLIAGTALAQQTQTTTNMPHRQMHGNMKTGCMMKGGMMGMPGNMGPGMMGGGMMGMHGNMMGPGMMGGGPGNWGMGCNGMMGGMIMNRMTPDQQQAFMDQTVDLRKQMMEKRFTYMEAMRNPSTTPQELAAIEKEMLELRTTMMDKMSTMHTK